MSSNYCQTIFPLHHDNVAKVWHSFHVRSMHLQNYSRPQSHWRQKNKQLCKNIFESKFDFFFFIPSSFCFRFWYFTILFRARLNNLSHPSYVCTCPHTHTYIYIYTNYSRENKSKLFISSMGCMKFFLVVDLHNLQCFFVLSHVFPFWQFYGLQTLYHCKKKYWVPSTTRMIICGHGIHRKSTTGDCIHPISNNAFKLKKKQKIQTFTISFSFFLLHDQFLVICDFKIVSFLVFQVDGMTQGI